MPRGIKYGYSTQAFATIQTKKCGTCGKMFECSIDTRYRSEDETGYTYYCGYRCFRVFDKAREEKVRERMRKETEQMYAAEKRQLTARQKKFEELLEHTVERIAYYEGKWRKAKPGSNAKTTFRNRRRDWINKQRNAEVVLRAVYARLDEIEREMADGVA